MYLIVGKLTETTGVKMRLKKIPRTPSFFPSDTPRIPLRYPRKPLGPKMGFAKSEGIRIRGNGAVTKHCIIRISMIKHDQSCNCSLGERTTKCQRPKCHSQTHLTVNSQRHSCKIPSGYFLRKLAGCF